MEASIFVGSKDKIDFVSDCVIEGVDRRIPKFLFGRIEIDLLGVTAEQLDELAEKIRAVAQDWRMVKDDEAVTSGR